MTLTDIQYTFNRAMAHTFERKKCFLAFLVLAICGVFMVFFRGAALNTGPWVWISLTLMPLFICSGVILSMGIILVRVYHNELKGKTVSYGDVVWKSLEILVVSSYFSVPVILSYLLLWMMLGVFVLLEGIPGIGEFVSAVLAFTPFVLNLGTILLVLLCVCLLYVVAPVMAFKGLNRITVIQSLLQRIQQDPFSNILLGSIAVLPFLFVFSVLLLSAYLTGTVCYHCESPLHSILQSFFIMIPFAAGLAPAIVFFFNFSAESHILLQKVARSKTQD